MPRGSRKREDATGPGRLTSDTVVDAALALIERRGLEGLTMRALGVALGVEAMSLYHWFGSKERLLDAIADRLIRQVAIGPAPSAAGWKAWMTDIARAYRRMGLAYPRAFPLVGARRFLSPGAIAFIQGIVAANLAAGFDLRCAVRLTRSVGAFVNGIVLMEVTPPASAPTQEVGVPKSILAPAQWQRALGFIARSSLDGAFEYGLGCLLDGAWQSRSRIAARDLVK